MDHWTPWKSNEVLHVIVDFMDGLLQEPLFQYVVAHQFLLVVEG